MDRKQFQQLLESKRDWLVVYLSAPWCAPCAVAEPLIAAHVARLPSRIAYLHLNVDTCGDVFAALRAKKQVRGIPALLAYQPGNTTLISDASCSGADETDIAAVFRKLGLNLPT